MHSCKGRSVRLWGGARQVGGGAGAVGSLGLCSWCWEHAESLLWGVE